MKKQHLPQKTCVVCQLPFTWRKKWEKNWESFKNHAGILKKILL
ncbi:DUF2256 domain-containing protein [Confluentibacter flavum]|uniref:DUF2256 domain-containing protein n=1 Tax=Confluentibacter flavum TaxID=1909700 RepID=A0A2N3HND7_9FLAO|nr:DUF2256 domain-containing protein [Confluentibacter flavum]PKQ46422.1 DUF2256 domain-containing protein [Confluentibacter flavum]